jgi:5'-nucleotidase / UDP-sugar diphosphatase
MKSFKRLPVFTLALLLLTGLIPSGNNTLILPELRAAAAGSSQAMHVTSKSAPAKTEKITVLFFNDLHGNLMPFKIKKDDGTTVEVGGIAGIATLVKQIRTENKKLGIKTFLLVAGDVLQGTPMSTVFKGKPDIEIFNALGVNAMTVGNHEFDFGLENFLAMKKAAKFPIISSNIIWKDTKKMVNDPVASLPINSKMTLTVIGATTTELLTTTAPSNVEKLDVMDSVQTVLYHFLKSFRKGPVILLSHSKFQTDSDIAGRIGGLTAIIGGHDQILFDPVKIANGVPVFQAFEKGRYLGRIDISIDPVLKRGDIVKSNYIPITSEIQPDPQVKKIVDSYSAKLDATFKEIIGESLVFMDGERGRIRFEETNLGNFVTDVMRNYTSSDIAFINAGSLRSSLDKGPINIEGVFKVMPYPNEIIVSKLTGKEILEALSRSVQGSRADEDGGFLHVSGVSFTIKGKKVDQVTVGGTAIDPAKTYSVTITDFMYSGGDGYTVFSGKPATKTGLPLRELLVDTIRKQGTVNAAVEGRIRRND